MTHLKKMRRPKGLMEGLSTLSEALGRITPLDMRNIRFSTALGTKSVPVPPSPVSPSTPSQYSTFTTHRVRVFTKEGWNKYEYSEIPQKSKPAIEISPPDSAPPQEPPPPVIPWRQSAVSSFAFAAVGACEGHRRAVSVDTKKPLPALPARPTVAEMEADIAEARRARAHASSEAPPETPPLSPAESFSLPEKFPLQGTGRFPTPPSRMPPSPPSTPDRTSVASLDSLSWLSLELAIADGEEGGSGKGPEPEPWKPFLPFSPPSSPFDCTFSDTDFPEPSCNKEPVVEQRRPPPPQTFLTHPPEVLLPIFTQPLVARDISSLALASSPLHSIFTTNAMEILGTALSPALSDLLAFGGPYQTYQHYTAAITHYADTAVAMKLCIRRRCKNFLSKHLLSPQTAAQEHSFGDAIYNVWSFCGRFARAPAHTETQAAWLRARGLAMPALRDMLEIYACIGALLCPLTSDLSLAVKAGILEDLGHDRMALMEAQLELWVIYLQMQDMGLILPVVSVPEEDEAGRWDAVVTNRLAEWAMDGDNNALRMFLKGAVGKVYAELSAAERKRAVEAKWGREGVWGETWD